MSERITRTDVDRIAETISTPGFEVRAQGRNGYIGLDLYRDGQMVDTLHAGTKREVYTYMQGIRRYQLETGR